MTVSKALVPGERRHIRQVRGPGFDLLAFINEDVGRVIWLTHAFEVEETHYFQREIRPTDICVDIGGNVGYMSMLFAANAPKGQVHVFEPIELNAALINASAALNGFGNIKVNNVAVGSERGSVKFSVASDSAYSSMIATGRSAEAQSIEVPVTTLDEYVASQLLERVDILKVDVEGAENLVIEGAKNLLSDHSRRPRLVLLELFEDNLKPFGSSVAQCIQRMQSFGYLPHVVLPGTERLVRFRQEMTNKFYNVLFLLA
jgi:FkbM family methyltransferase